MLSALDISFGGEKMVVNADRTLWWPKRQILFVADIHAGKTEHMRRYGVAVPSGGLEDDLDRLQRAAKAYGPQKIIILGDLFHSEINTEWISFAAWCRAQDTMIELVNGNHDRFLTDKDIALAGIVAHDEPHYMSPFMLRHHPDDSSSEAPSLVGHIHPVVNLYGPAREKWRLSCFAIQEKQLILPSFGSFTGGYRMKLSECETIYACSDDYSSVFTAKC